MELGNQEKSLALIDIKKDQMKNYILKILIGNTNYIHFYKLLTNFA